MVAHEDWTERHALIAALLAVMDLHKPVKNFYANAPEVEVCAHCTSGGDAYVFPEGCDRFPCLTMRKIFETPPPPKPLAAPLWVETTIELLERQAKEKG